MREVDYSVPFDKLPVWLAPLSIVMLFVPLIPFVLQRGFAPLFNETWTWWLFPVLILLILAHEAVHAIGWKYASGLDWSQFKFGFSWKGLAPYCHATAPMLAQPYRIGGILPAIVTGVLPLLIGYMLNSAPLILIGGVMISAAVGDVFVLWTIRHLPKDAKVLDHPSQVGCIAWLPEQG